MLRKTATIKSRTAGIDLRSPVWKFLRPGGASPPFVAIPGVIEHGLFIDGNAVVISSRRIRVRVIGENGLTATPSKLRFPGEKREACHPVPARSAFAARGAGPCAQGARASGPQALRAAATLAEPTAAQIARASCDIVVASGMARSFDIAVPQFPTRSPRA